MCEVHTRHLTSEIVARLHDRGLSKASAIDAAIKIATRSELDTAEKVVEYSEQNPISGGIACFAAAGLANWLAECVKARLERSR